MAKLLAFIIRLNISCFFKILNMFYINTYFEFTERVVLCDLTALLTICAKILSLKLIRNVINLYSLFTTSLFDSRLL